MSDKPTAALDACDDPLSRFQVRLRALEKALRFCSDSLKRFNDVMWPIIESLPPGALSEEDTEDEG